jgi:hypothetical protein
MNKRKITVLKKRYFQHLCKETLFMAATLVPTGFAPRRGRSFANMFSRLLAERGKMAVFFISEIGYAKRGLRSAVFNVEQSDRNEQINYTPAR